MGCVPDAPSLHPSASASADTPDTLASPLAPRPLPGEKVDGKPVSGPDLSCVVDGVKFPNPFVIGSGPPGTNYHVMKKAFDEGWGGVIAKTVTLDSSKVINVTPRYARMKSSSNQKEVIGWENIELVSDRPFEKMMQEFKRLKSIHSSMQDRADLLGDVESGSNAPLLPLSSNSSAILRERANIGGVNNALDDVIGQAQNVASSLMQQRRVFDGVNSKLTTLGSRFPVVNSLLTSIRRRKAKDTIVMSLVVALCLALMLLYMFS